MAGTAIPTLSGVNVQITPTVVGLQASAGSGGTVTNCGLFDANTTSAYNTSSSFYWSVAGDYVEIIIPKKSDIYRSGLASYPTYNNKLQIMKKNSDNTYTDVTNLYTLSCTAIDNTKWEKFVSGIPRGQYRFQYSSSYGYRMDNEWALFRSSNERAFEVTATNDVKSFNSNNVWYVTGLDKNNLTTTNYLTSGFDPYILNQPYTNIYINMTDCGVLDSADGGKLFLSDDIDKYLGTTSITLIDSDTNPQLQLTLPTFLPKDGLLSTDKLYFYSDEVEYTPEIMNVQFSSSTTHDSIVSVTVLGRYNWNKQVQFRFKIGSTYTSPWTTAQNPYDTCTMDISPINLKLGANDITIEMMDVTDNTKIGGKTITGAITVNNNAPNIAIISADSNSFKLHFTISDNDINDTAQYQLTLMNSKGNNIVVPWTTFVSSPDVTYYFDTTMVDVNKTNSVKIEYKDNYGAGGQTTYTFTGAYKNIMFIDEGGSYYTTDKGTLLKLLDFGQIIGGQYSDIVAITLKNQNVQSIKNMIVSQYSITGIPGITLELSKNSNPFIPIDTIDFGEQIFATNDTINFYVRIKSLDTAQGINDFEIDVNANIVS